MATTPTDKNMKGGYYWGTGRRKHAAARVRIREGSGRIMVNGRPAEEYFPLPRLNEYIRGPLVATRTQRSYDIWARIRGGGVSGQSGALAMGLSRALSVANEELTQTLRDGKFLTRDARMVERKKYGRKKARKSFQFSKR